MIILIVMIFVAIKKRQNTTGMIHAIPMELCCKYLIFFANNKLKISIFAHTDMKYNTHTLVNGLRIIHLPDVSPVIYCGYGIAAGTRHELDSQEGMAHFCEHATFKGTQRRGPLNIINCLERVGGDLNAFTNKESTVFYAALLKEHLPKAVDLLTDIVFHSTYPQQEIEKEVEVICDEIESYNDSPAELIFDDFENLLFAHHPLGHNILGQADRLRTYSSEQLRQFTASHYRANNAIFFAYGDISFDRLVKMLEKATADLPAGLPLVNRKEYPALPTQTGNRRVEIQKNTHQTHVMMGNRAYPVGHPHRIALYLLNNLLGGPGMSTRLNLALRERNGLVYSVDSSMLSYADTGTWCVYFGCDSHDTDRCIHLVKRELDRLMQQPLSDNAVRNAKRQLKGQIAVACDNRESFALDFAKGFLHYGWHKDITALYNEIDALDAPLLQKVAQEIFDSKAMTTLIYT